MIWAELGVGVGVALMAFGAGVLAGIIIAEWRLTALPKGARPQAERKGLALLGFWLSPKQAEQHSSYRYFDVIGSDSGSRYRIRQGCMMNIDQLDPAGNGVCAWCFLPVGNLATGDCMLAQKVALEMFESNALAVANHGPVYDLTGGALGKLERPTRSRFHFTRIQKVDRFARAAPRCSAHAQGHNVAGTRGGPERRDGVANGSGENGCQAISSEHA